MSRVCCPQVQFIQIVKNTVGIKSSGLVFVGNIDSEISTPMFTKKSLNAFEIIFGSVTKTLLIFSLSILSVDLFELIASFKNSHVFLVFF